LYEYFAVHGAFPYNRTFPSYTDVYLYGAWAHFVWQGLIPFRDFTVFYPPGILPIISLPSPSGSVYAAEFIAAAFIVDALVLQMLYRSGRHVGAAAWLFGAPLLGPIFWSRLDIFVAGALVAGLLCIESERYSCSAVWLVWAGLIKLWPFVLIVVLLRVVPRDKWRSYLTSAGGVMALGVLPVLDLGGTRGLWGVLQTQTVRGVEIESIFAIPLYIWRAAGHHIPIVEASAIQFSGPAGAVVADVSTAAFGCVMLLLVARAVRNRDPRPDATGWFMVISLAVLVTSKVLSPQYLVWVLAAVALRVDTARRQTSLLAATALLLLMTQAQFPFGFLQLATATRWALPLSVVHGVVLVIFAVVAYRNVVPSSWGNGPLDQGATRLRGP
jgi:hypothetical protein